MGTSGNLLGVHRLRNHLDNATRMGTFANYTQLERRRLYCSRCNGKSPHRDTLILDAQPLTR